jgi:flagellar hook-length control protein FliK
LKERLQFAVNSVTKKLNFKKDISEFLITSKAALIIREAASKIVNKDIGLDGDISVKKSLFLSTADVIGYRQAMSNMAVKKDLIPKNLMGNFSVTGEETNDLTLKASDEQLSALRTPNINNNMTSNFGSVAQAHVAQNIARHETFVDRSSILQTQSFSQRISLLETQFSSRLANALLEQAINSNESFDLILEPESFGKVRVNVSIDSSQIDVKLTAENASTLAILRSSEGILQTISEQNGLKLAEYNVELNNNAQNNEGSQGRKNSKDQNDNSNEGVEKLQTNLDPLDENDDNHSLNLIA